MIWSDVRRKLNALVSSPVGRVVRADGRVWHLSPEGEAFFASAAPNIDEWLANFATVGQASSLSLPSTDTIPVSESNVNSQPVAVKAPRPRPGSGCSNSNDRLEACSTVVKHGSHRTVYRVTLTSSTVYVKHCRINGPRAWAREVMRPPKARLEFENATRLRSLDIGAAIPLAWGVADSVWPGASYLITRDLAPAIPLTDFLESRFVAFTLRRQIARGLGRFLARLHDCGIAHPDPHAGNVVVEIEGNSREPRFSLLDVHAVRFGPSLSWEDSRANLILFNRWFQLRASAADRYRFWREYCDSRQTLRIAREEAKELELATLASNRRFWMARTERYKGTHRSIRKVHAGRVRGLAVRDLPDDFLRELLADPDAAFTRPGTKLLKQCVSSTVAELELPTPTGSRTVILKRVNARTALDAVKNFFRSSAVRRSWLFGHSLCERWLPTPRPLAMFHRNCSGMLPAEGYLLTEKVPDAIGLSEAVKACRDSRILRVWSERLARVVRKMHDRGVSHRDLKAPNVMLQGAAIDPANATPMLIDLVGVRASASAVPFARRTKELARLNASFLAMSNVTRTQRLRFLLTYLQSGARELDWKKWWNAVSLATVAKVEKNRRSGRVLG